MDKQCTLKYPATQYNLPTAFIFGLASTTMATVIAVEVVLVYYYIMWYRM